jgi:hypothetical protein
MSSKKTDSVWAETGRRWNEEDAREALAALDASGLSAEGFARAQGFSAQRLWWWRHRLASAPKHSGPRRAPHHGASLLPVVVRQRSVETQGAIERCAVVSVRVGVARIDVEDPGSVDPAWVATLVTTIGSAT